MLREPNRDIAKSIREDEVRQALDVDMRPASELPLEPPVVLERKALNQLDKREDAEAGGAEEAKDDEEHREKQEQKLRNAQTKARTKRAKARDNKLAA